MTTIAILARRWGGPEGGRDGMSLAVAYLAWTLADLGVQVHCYLPSSTGPPWQREGVTWMQRPLLVGPDDWSAVDLVINSLATSWRRTAIAAQRAGAQRKTIYWHHHGSIPAGHGCTLARVADTPDKARGWGREIVLPPSSWAIAEGGERVGNSIVVTGASRRKGGRAALAVAQVMPDLSWYVLPGRANSTDLAPWRDLSNAVVAPPGLQPAMWLAQARAVLSPSRAETYGLAMVEAAVRGVPVVTSDLPGPRYALRGSATYLPMDAPVDQWVSALRTALAADHVRLCLPSYPEVVSQALELRGVTPGRAAVSPPLVRVPAPIVVSRRKKAAKRSRRQRGSKPVDAISAIPSASAPQLRSSGRSGLISVLMAVGPVHRWLSEAVQSVLDQGLPDGWELELLIAVDGVSESLEAARLCAADPRVGIVSLPANVGPYVAFNTLLRHASGSLVGCMGADDAMLPGRLAALIGALDDAPAASMANSTFTQTDVDLRLIRHIGHPADGIWLWRRSALDWLGGWQAWPCGADTEMFQRARRLGLQFAVIPESLYLHRQHGDQLTKARGTAPGTPLRKAAWSLIHAQNELAKSGGRLPRIVPETSPHSVEGPLFDAPIWAGLASIPSRRESLAQVVASLLPQVDQIGVYLNGYPDVPEFLLHDRISVVCSLDEGDRGDAGKMFWAAQAPGYYLSCDDDLLYPPDYAARLVGAVQARGNGAVVGLHGALIHPGATHYHRDRTVLHCLRDVAEDEPVHLLGSGVAAWHAPTFKVRSSDFEAPNMADLWLAALGQRTCTPFFCLAHLAGWLRDLGSEGPTIWAACAEHTGGPLDTRTRQDRLVRELAPWALHGERSWTPVMTSDPGGMPATPAAAPAAPEARAKKRRGKSARS